MFINKQVEKHQATTRHLQGEIVGMKPLKLKEKLLGIQVVGRRRQGQTEPGQISFKKLQLQVRHKIIVCKAL